MGKYLKSTLFLVLFVFYGCGAASSNISHDITTKQNTTKSSVSLGGTHIFGDSIFATLNHRIKSLLETKTGKTIIDHSETGKWAWEIKNQYINARNQKPDIVIMDGGGNDVFGNATDCKKFNDKCKTVVKNAVKAVEDTFNLMHEDGVRYVFFLGCHYPRGWYNGYDLVVDYSYTLLEPLCREANVVCTIIDPREKFNATSNALEWDGVHPNNVGTEILADMISEELPLFTIQD